MIEALVKFGVKDQNVVLSTINKIKKAKADIAKKTDVGFFAKERYGQRYGAAASASKFGIGQGAQALKSAILNLGKDTRSAEQKKIDDYKKEQFENSKLVRGAREAGNQLLAVGRAAASLDPVQFIQGMLTAAGTAATAIPFLGNVAKGAAEAAGISVGAAGGAVGSAKQNIPAALELEKRYATSNRYGGNLFKSKDDLANERIARANVEAKYAPKIAKAQAADDLANKYAPAIEKALKPIYEKRKQDTSFLERRANTAGDVRSDLEREFLTSSTKAGGSAGWTPTDKAQLIASLASAYGKVQEPLATAINGLITQGKNVEQLTQVASGNWGALGTDKGAIFQQISDSFAGALPSVKQRLQAALLTQYGGELESEKGSDLARRRATASSWEQQGERHTREIANLAQKMGTTLLQLDENLHRVSLNLIGGAQKLAAAVNDAANLIGLSH